MKTTSSAKLWAAALTATAATVLGLTLASAAPAEQPRGTTTQISIEFDGSGPPSFQGPATIPQGYTLRIVNNTDPQQIGPHTFTLTRKNAIPKGKDEFKACGKLELKVCKRIAKAHKVNPKTFDVGKPFVDTGKSGWNKKFGSGQDGDSWLTESEDEVKAAEVSGKVGKKMSYFCVIHPEMRGEFVITAPRTN